jgi:hypothetical protein
MRKTVGDDLDCNGAIVLAHVLALEAAESKRARFDDS